MILEHLTSMSATSKPARLEARVTSEQKRLIEHAAELEGRTITDFVVASVASAARQVIQDHDTLKLTARDREVFVQALMRPPAANENLRQAVRRYKEAFR
jgi:uncharacterized protein (DUF1778 family)